MSLGAVRLFPALKQRGNLLLGSWPPRVLHLLAAVDALHPLNATAAPVWNSGGGQLIPHQCTTELVMYIQGTSGWTNLGKWSEDRKPDHKQLVIHSVFRLLSWCTSFLYPRKISHHQKSICHVLKQDASPHAQDGYPLSFNINFSFLGNKSSHYPPEALTVFSFIAFRSPSRLQSKWVLWFSPTFSRWYVFIT